MNDPTPPEPIEDALLEELEPEAAPLSTAPASVPAMMPMMGPQPAHKQLYQFLWGGIAVLFGCLLPFNDYADDWKADRYRHVPDALVDETKLEDIAYKDRQTELWVANPGIAGTDATASPGPIGIMTFAGAFVAFCAMLFIGAQLFCIKYRKVMLAPIGLMAFLAFFAWLRFFRGGPSDLGFQAGLDSQGKPFPPTAPEWVGEFKAYTSDGGASMVKMLYDGTYISDYFTHLGIGYFFVLAGSTYVLLTFVMTILGVGAPKKRAVAPAGAPSGGGRSGGRGGRRR